MQRFDVLKLCNKWQFSVSFMYDVFMTKMYILEYSHEKRLERLYERLTSCVLLITEITLSLLQ